VIEGADGDAIEVNRLWGWLVQWWAWLVEGHTYQLTIAAFTDHPVTHEFTDRSLNDGIWPYRASDAVLKTARSTASQARTHLTFLEREVPTLEAEVLKLFREETRWAATEKSWRDCLEKTPQAPLCVQELKRVLEVREGHVRAIDSREQKIQAGKAQIEACPATIKKADAEITKAEADLQLDNENRVWCLLRVEMPPVMPPLLQEILEQLEGTIGAALQKFAKFMRSNDDRLLRAKFQKAGVQLIAAHEREASTLPPSRQLTGAVQSDHDPRVFSGIIFFDSDNDVIYYSIETLQDAQANGIPINDDTIEAQAVFVENLEDIWNAPYPASLSQNKLAARAYKATQATQAAAKTVAVHTILTSQAEQDAQDEQEERDFARHTNNM
jgi:hypothetical protein